MDKLSLCFNGDDFTNFISFVKTMNFRDKTRGSKAVLLHVENDSLVCRAIDDTSNYIEYNVELYKTDNTITDYVSASVNDLAALIKCSSDGDRFTIRKQFNQYEFNIIGNGWLPFKTLEVDLDKFDVSGNDSEIGSINSIKLKNAITSVLSYTQECTYNRDKYIQFSKTQMSVTSRSSSVVTKDEFIDMILHRDNAAMLRSLLKDNFDLSVHKIESSIQRISFIGPKFKLTFIQRDADVNSVEFIDNIKDYITIDCDELYKLVMFSEEYSASKHIIGMSVKNKSLQINVKNILAAKHTSTIKSTAVGDVLDTSSEAEVPAYNLLKALKLFQDKRSREVNIYITDELLSSKNSIVLFDDSTQSIINIYNR